MRIELPNFRNPTGAVDSRTWSILNHGGRTAYSFRPRVDGSGRPAAFIVSDGWTTETCPVSPPLAALHAALSGLPHDADLARQGAHVVGPTLGPALAVRGDGRVVAVEPIELSPVTTSPAARRLAA